MNDDYYDDDDSHGRRKVHFLAKAITAYYFSKLFRGSNCFPSHIRRAAFDDSAYICRSCSISSSATTLYMDEEGDDEYKEIYRSFLNSNINKLFSRSQKSSVSFPNI
jgi:hypothetical protein